MSKFLNLFAPSLGGAAIVLGGAYILADQFVTGDGQILASNLYVAMTRARSLLAIYGLSGGSAASLYRHPSRGRSVACGDL